MKKSFMLRKMLAHADKVFWPEAVKHLMTTGLRATTAKWKYDTTAKRKYDTTTKRKFDRTAKKEIWIEGLHIWKIPLCQNCKAIKYQDSVKIFHHSTQPTQWINKQTEQLSYDIEPTQDVFPIVLHLFSSFFWAAGEVVGGIWVVGWSVEPLRSFPPLFPSFCTIKPPETPLS